MSESLIDNLAHVSQLKVKSRNSVFHFKGKEVDPQKAGHELGVSALLSGRVAPRGDSIEVSAELTDVRDSTVIWGQHYSRKSADISRFGFHEVPLQEKNFQQFCTIKKYRTLSCVHTA